jgi:hypothetical protein
MLSLKSKSWRAVLRLSSSFPLPLQPEFDQPASECFRNLGCNRSGAMAYFIPAACRLGRTPAGHRFCRR